MATLVCRRVRRATPRAVQVYLLDGRLLLWLPRYVILGGADLQGGDWDVTICVRTDFLLEKLSQEEIEEGFIHELLGEQRHAC